MKHQWLAWVGALSAAISMNSSVYAVTENLSSGAPSSVPGEKRSVPQAVLDGEKSLSVERFLTNAAPSRTLTIDAYSADQLQKKMAETAATGKNKVPLVAGVGRDVPISSQLVRLADLSWSTLANGSRVAKMAVRLTDGVGMRLGYRIDGPVDGLTLRFGTATQDTAYIGAPIESGARSWSPTIDSAEGIVEFALRADANPATFEMRLEKISQLAKVGGDLKGASPRAPSVCSSSPNSIGCRDACNIDLACIQNPSQALRDVGKATTKYLYTDDSDGRTYICTGTLLNSNASPRRPYIYTAAHCISTQREASTMETYWFFDSISCADTISTPPFQRITTGASLKLADENMDVSLVEMNSSPPLGVVFASWDATIIPRTAILVGVHHPYGDLKTFSEGTMQGYEKLTSIDNFIKVRWTPGKGTTEQGSSGSGIFTYNEDCGGGAPCYQLRGGLEGGAASCQNPTGADYYSRMDLLFTKLSPYLSPSSAIPTTTSSQASMVEYYNPQFDYYFMTSRETEKSILDGIRNTSGDALWYRTGYWFKTDPFATPNTSSLTRYYVPGAAKNSQRGTHFYTVLTTDRQAITSTGKERFSSSGCSDVANTFFCNEGTDSYAAPPIGSGAAGRCAAGEQSVWRVFRGNSRFPDDANHRYVTTPGLYNYMVNELGWDAEFVNMCVRP